MRRHRLMRPEVSTVPCEGNDLLHLARNQPAETLDAGAGNDTIATSIGATRRDHASHDNGLQKHLGNHADVIFGGTGDELIPLAPADVTSGADALALDTEDNPDTAEDQLQIPSGDGRTAYSDGYDPRDALVGDISSEDLDGKTLIHPDAPAPIVRRLQSVDQADAADRHP